jgi:phage gp16-like protein
MKPSQPRGLAGRKAPSDQRARLIKLIHVAKRELHMDDATYRVMLRASGGADSTASMDVPALDRVLARLRHAGFKVRHKQEPPAAPAPSRRLDTSDQARKVRALWLLLHTLGVVHNPSEASLAAYVKRIAGVDDLHWTTSEQINRLIETLKKWAMRYLPAVNERMHAEAVALGRCIPFNAVRQIAMQTALDKQAKPTFGNQWIAWSLWCQVLGRDVPPQLFYLQTGEAM